MAFAQDIAINSLWYSNTGSDVPTSIGASAINGAIAVNTANGNMWVKVTGGGLTGNWEAVGGGTGNFTSINLAGDSGVSQTIENTNTITIAGGTALSTVAGSTDTVTINHDTSAGNKHIPAGGSTDQVLTYSSSGTATWEDPASDYTFTAQADSGTQRTINNTDDLAIEGGSGVTTSIGAIGSGGATITIAAAGIATNASNHTAHTASTAQHGIPSGGNSGEVLSTNGSGTYSWIAAGGTTDISASTAFPGQLTYYGGSGSGNEYDLDPTIKNATNNTVSNSFLEFKENGESNSDYGGFKWLRAAPGVWLQNRNHNVYNTNRNLMITTDQTDITSTKNARWHLPTHAGWGTSYPQGAGANEFYLTPISQYSAGTVAYPYAIEMTWASRYSFGGSNRTSGDSDVYMADYGSSSSPWLSVDSYNDDLVWDRASKLGLYKFHNDTYGATGARATQDDEFIGGILFGGATSSNSAVVMGTISFQQSVAAQATPTGNMYFNVYKAGQSSTINTIHAIRGDSQQSTFGYGYYLGTTVSVYSSVGTGNTATSHSWGISVNGSIYASSGVTATTLSISGTKNFRIPHPLPALKSFKDLVHTSIEAPRADLIYRGTATLSSGSATVNIDTTSNMTSGTFVLLTQNVEVWLQNKTGWTEVRGSISGATLTITAQDNSSTDTVAWLVMAERADDEIKANTSVETDSDGHLIVESYRVNKPIVAAGPMSTTSNTERPNKPSIGPRGQEIIVRS